ncbi:hypothetical protein BL243_07915 [Ralstonia solanacearum]|nr:hypothetical protein BL243_07915 [Ralstonia solanacearum]
MLRTLSDLHFAHPALQISVCGRVVVSSVESRIHIDVLMLLMERAVFFVLAFFALPRAKEAPLRRSAARRFTETVR